MKLTYEQLQEMNQEANYYGVALDDEQLDDLLKDLDFTVIPVETFEKFKKHMQEHESYICREIADVILEKKEELLKEVAVNFFEEEV